MAIDKKLLSEPPPSSEADHNDRVVQDISRIVNYLNSNRAGVSHRASGLLQELSHSRELGSAAKAKEQASPQKLAAQIAQSMAHLPEPEHLSASTHSHPVLAARYHTFCHDLDVLLQSFRDRLASSKPIKH